MKGIIFDLDGVICSTDEYHYQAWKKLADRLNIRFDRAVNNRLRGVSRMESLEIILENYIGICSPEEKKEFAEEKNITYRGLLKGMSPNDVSAEVTDTLNILRARNFKLAIGSSSKNAAFILNKIGLGNFFDAVSDGNNITNSKPDPEVFIKAAEYIGLTAKDCLVVEDAYAGIDAAIRGGFVSVGIGDACNYEKADYRIKSFCGLLEICR